MPAKNLPQKYKYPYSILVYEKSQDLRASHFQKEMLKLFQLSTKTIESVSTFNSFFNGPLAFCPCLIYYSTK
jgi:hypothetical protein